MFNDGLNPGTRMVFNYDMALPTLVARAQVNQVKGVYPKAGAGAGIPAHVSDVRATVTNATVGSTCTVVIFFHRNPSDSAFSSAKVYVQGYNGTHSPTLLTAGSESPVQFVLNNTGESISVMVQASGNGGDAALSNAPMVAVKLPLGPKGFGVASSPLPIGFPAQSYGSNLVPNGGFEFNTSNAALDTVLAAGATLCDGWTTQNGSSGNNAQFQISLSSNAAAVHSGARTAKILIPSGFVVQASSLAQTTAMSSAKVPLVIGSVIRVSGYVNFSQSAAPPAGVTVAYQIGMAIYNQGGTTLLGTLNVEATGVTTGSQYFQAAVTVPATMGGGVPSYARAYTTLYANNVNGSPTTLPAVNPGTAYFDDIKFIVQTTAFDLTPINTAGTPTSTTAICNQHTNVSKQIDVSATTMQFGDGTVTYNSGTVTTSPALPSGPWFIYADDPTFSGGAVTYVATLTPADCNAANGRILFGEISLVNGGALTPGTGGGTGGGGPRGKGYNVP